MGGIAVTPVTSGKVKPMGDGLGSHDTGNHRDEDPLNVNKRAPEPRIAHIEVILSHIPHGPETLRDDEEYLVLGADIYAACDGDPRGRGLYVEWMTQAGDRYGEIADQNWISFGH